MESGRVKISATVTFETTIVPMDWDASDVDEAMEEVIATLHHGFETLIAEDWMADEKDPVVHVQYEFLESDYE